MGLYSPKILPTLNSHSVIELENVGVEFGKVTALKNLTLTVKRGMLLYVVGPNGSGKTTLIRLLVGLLNPTTGTVRRANDAVGYLPQKLLQNPNFPITVEEVIYSGLKNQKLLITTTKRQLIIKWLRKMEIEHLLKSPMATLSGGQQQRVLLIRALIKEPNLLILDEPTSALDPSFRKYFNEFIMKLHKEGKTIIFVTHDLHETLCDCATILYVDQDIKFFGSLTEYHNNKEDHHHV